MRRRITICVLALLILAGRALAATLCVNAPQVVALTDSRGNELLAGDGIAEVFAVREGELYAAGQRGAYHLYDASGQPLGDVEFSMIDDAGDTLVYRSGGLFGAMDVSGNVLLPAVWTQLTADGSGGWLALETDPLDEKKDEIIHIGADGGARATGVYIANGLSRVSGGRMPYMDANRRYGAVDASGAVVVQPTWQYLGPFVDGLAKATGPEGVGMIDSQGRTVIPAVYTWLDRGSAMIVACDGNGVDIWPPLGGQRRLRLPGPAREVALVGSCLSVAYADRVCLYDARGRQLAQYAPGTVFVTGSGGQLVASDGEWGEKCQWLVNSDGSTASGRFQQLLPLCENRYAFLEMDGISYYSAELKRLQKSWDYANCRYGVVDASGRILVPARYREIRSLGNERLLLIGDDETRLADRNGVMLKVWPALESAEPSAEADG